MMTSSEPTVGITPTMNAATPNANGAANNGASPNSYRNRAHLTVQTDDEPADGGSNDPKTPPGVRGHSDLRSPGVKKTPLNADGPRRPSFRNNDEDDRGERQQQRDGTPASPLADFITQTDKYGNASTPRTADGIAAARRMHPSGPKPNLRVDDETGALVQDDDNDDNNNAINVASADGAFRKSDIANANGGAGENPAGGEDACDTLLDSFRMMCCCLLPEDPAAAGRTAGGGAGDAKDGSGGTAPSTPVDAASDANGNDSAKNNNDSNNNNGGGGALDHPIGYSTRGHDAPLLLEEHSALRNGNDPDRIKLLPELHADDRGKKCLVLDLDETLVHSSFRAVPGADFVIPVQIEDVVHFVYVAKRPGVDEFLLEMAKHYEIVVYTASLNKYADVLLDLLDPHRVIRTRLFRESCVFYEGNYVKDLSLLNRDLSQSIIIDNSPASYLFHPENAIDCTSFIDDVSDRELVHIGKFLAGMKDVEDVRGTVNLWRHWPNVDLTKNHRRIR